jgi:hypothetical protein
MVKLLRDNIATSSKLIKQYEAAVNSYLARISKDGRDLGKIQNQMRRNNCPS